MLLFQYELHSQKTFSSADAGPKEGRQKQYGEYCTEVHQVKCTNSAFVIDSVILMIPMSLGDSDDSNDSG